jgi:hypothetical protein
VPVPALSVMLRVPDVEPVGGETVGAKMTPMTHEVPPGAKVLPQVVAGLESIVNNALLVEGGAEKVKVPPGLALLLVTVTNNSLVVPRVTVPKLTVAGVTAGAESVPLPVSAIEAGLFLALLVILKLPPALGPAEDAV